jgi:hypothetical protein
MPSYEKKDFPTEWTIWCDEDEEQHDEPREAGSTQQPSPVGDQGGVQASPGDPDKPEH